MENQYKDTAVICYQKANPPTKVHLQFFKKVIATAVEKKGDPLIFLSQEYDAKQNPMPWKLKMNYIASYFNNKVYVCNREDVRSLKDILSFVYQRHYKNVIIIAGNEIIPSLKLFIDQNSSDDKKDDEKNDNAFFKFDSLEAVSSGGKDPDNESDSSTYSPSQARNAILDNDINKFSSIVMASNQKQVMSLFSIIKAGMGLTEHIIKNKKRG